MDFATAHLLPSCAGGGGGGAGDGVGVAAATDDAAVMATDDAVMRFGSV